MRPDQPLVIGFETSCDETGVGLVRGHTLLADALATSVGEHERFGGVVPEIASRAHLEAMVPTVHRALEDRKSTRLNSSHANISYAVFCLKKKKSLLLLDDLNQT